jgi:aldehyde dehydrogenase (NAD+)
MIVTEDRVAKESTLSLLKAQRFFFASGKTLKLEFRIAQLKRLRQAIIENEERLSQALYNDLRKSKFEAYGTEIGIVISEIDDALAHISSWVKPQKVSTPLIHFKASSAIYSDPYGVALIISPWNYPFQLLLAPLVGAIAAGNCSMLKPSEVAPHTSSVITEMISKTFDPSYVTSLEGDAEVTQDLLKNKFDYIFFTGGTEVGRIIYQAAAKFLTPVTLELGGKSPCIVDEDIHLEYAAKRITWGKFINCGQTCIAPDYLLVNKKIKTKLVDKINITLKEFYGDDPSKSNDYPRIINHRHFNRLKKYLTNGKVIIGGETNETDKYIAPTLIDNPDKDSAVMKEEIFGPILPLIGYSNIDEAIQFINQRPKPLALYVFSNNTEVVEKVLAQTSSGGSCVNDTVMHIANSNMGFGGVGESGIGAYHGKLSFDTFSHKKSVFIKSNLLDIKLKYPPYTGETKFKLIKWLMKWFM